MKLTVPLPSGMPAELARPEILARAVPGCRSVTPVESGGVRIVVDVAVAAVRGLWAGTVTEVAAGEWRVVGAGEPGKADLTVRLAADADTDATLTIEGTVEGPLADIGSTLLAAAVRRLVLSLMSRSLPGDQRQLAGGAT